MNKATSDFELSGAQLLYTKPQVLHSIAHADLCYDCEAHTFGYAEKAHLVPLLVSEFSKAMMHYPIIFAGAERTPLAVMGLAPEQNLFVTEACFEKGAYVPAYLRRYPFTLATAEDDRLVVCIDRSAPGFRVSGCNKGKTGARLFENGETTDFTKKAIAFLDEFEAERCRTQAFIDMLEARDLFEVKSTLFVSGDAQERLADYFAISEERVRALSNEALGDLVKTGATSRIAMHLASLQRWDDLIVRRLKCNEPVAKAA